LHGCERLIHALVIAILAIPLLEDELPAVPLLPDLSPALVAGISLGPFVLLALGVQLVIARLARRLDRTGEVKFIRQAHRAVAISRVLLLLFYANAVLCVGWQELVRRVLGGNLVLVDELIVTLPPLFTLIAGWWSLSAIDQRVTQATLIRALDSGAPLPTLVSRAAHVGEQIRHHLLFLLIPIFSIIAWTEIIDRATRSLESNLPGEWVQRISVGAQVSGVVLVIALMPLVLRVLWNTSPMEPGPIHARLTALFETQGARCRSILIWRTQGGLLNGAVIGVLPQLRYILLTESLIERLNPVQIEAVMAHEVAHARRHHLPWLMAAMIVCIALSWGLVSLGVGAILPAGFEHTASERMDLLVVVIEAIVALGVGLSVFGGISRRFEQQADAFAAQHLSGMTRSTQDDAAIRITPEAAWAMSSALRDVAAFNGIPESASMWRHGSIGARRRRLDALIGVYASQLPIDRIVRHIKILTMIGLVIMLALAVWKPDLFPE